MDDIQWICLVCGKVSDQPVASCCGAVPLDVRRERILPGPLVLIKEIGLGAMGEVWLALQAGVSAGREVAVKLLREDVESRDGEAAFRHEHIVEVYLTGQAPDGRRFVVMEHLRGETLRERLEREQRLPPSQAWRLLRQIARGMEAAHTHRPAIYHRDLKPDNIMLVPGPQGDSAKVLDFGLAKIEGRDRTIAGTLMGTISYMAPEHLDLQQVHPPSPALDVYALGLIFLEMVLGRHARPITEGLASDVARITAHRTTPPEQLGDLYPGRFPKALLQLLDDALSVDPKRRIQDAGALVQRLRKIPEPPWFDEERFMATPVPDRPGEAGYTDVHRWRWVLGLGGAAVFLLSLLLLGHTLMPSQRKEAVGAIDGMNIASAKDGSPRVSSDLALPLPDLATPQVMDLGQRIKRPDKPRVSSKQPGPSKQPEPTKQPGSVPEQTPGSKGSPAHDDEKKRLKAVRTPIPGDDGGR